MRAPRLRALVLALTLLAAGGAGCIVQTDPQAEQALAQQVPGRYVADVDGQRAEMVLNADGSGTVNGQPGQWQIQLGTIMLSDGQNWVPATLAGDSLSVQMPDRVVVFQREVAPPVEAAAPAEQPAEGAGGAGVNGGVVWPDGTPVTENAELRARLVGCWEDYSRSASNSGSGSYQSTLRLETDGRYSRRTFSSVSAGGTSMVDDRTETGRFTVEGDALRMVSDDGQPSDRAVQLEGGILYLGGAKHLPCN